MPNDLVSDYIARGEFWDKHLKSTFDKYVNKDSICIDVGAHCGFHSVYLSKHCKTVYCFEPQKVIFMQLCGNLYLNECFNAVPFNMAVYDKECMMEISPQNMQVVEMPTISDGTPNYLKITNSAGLTCTPSDSQLAKIKAITIDSMNLDKLTLLKCDAQGGDLKVLKGAKDTIEKLKPIIIFEYEDKLTAIHGCTKQDYIDFFAGLKVRYNIEKLFELNANTGYYADHLCVPL